MSYNSSNKSISYYSNSKSYLNIRGKNNGNIVNPFFIKLIDYVDDPYWKDVLLDASRGKFPKEFSYNDNVLTCKKNNSSISIEENANSINRLIEFIRNITGTRSKMDLEREKDYEKEHNLTVNNINSWSDVKTKYNKRLLIIEYVSKLSKIYNLTQNETDELRTLINIHLDNDILKKSVIIEDNNISDITCFKWDSIKRCFNFVGVLKKNIVQKSNQNNIIYVENDIPLELYTVETIKNWNKLMKKYTKGIKKPLYIKNEDTSPMNHDNLSTKDSTEHEHNYMQSSSS